MSSLRPSLIAGLALLALTSPACVTEKRMLEIPARGRALGELDRRLGSRHDAVRAGAARELGRRKAQGALASLSRLLTDPSPRVRLAAVEGLAALASRPALEAVERALLDADPVVRLASAQAVSQQPLAAALPALIRMLGARELALKQLAVNRLYTFGPPVLPSLWPLLRDGNEAARRVAAQVLRNLRGRHFQEAMVDLTMRFEQQEADRSAVVVLLRSIGPLAVERLVLQLLAAETAGEIAVYARLLGAVGRSALPPLRAAYLDLFKESEDPSGDEEDPPRAVHEDRDPADPEGSAARRKRAMQAAEAAQERRERQKGACEQALIAIGAAGVLALVELSDAQVGLQSRVSDCLETAPASVWAPALALGLRHRKADVRELLLMHVSLKDRSPVPLSTLAPYFRDPSTTVRHHARIILMHTEAKGGEVLEVLQGAIRHWEKGLPTTEPVLTELVESLHLAGPVAVSALVPLARSSRAPLRRAALPALGRAACDPARTEHPEVGPDEAAAAAAQARKVLLQALRGTDDGDAAEAVEGLAFLRNHEAVSGAAGHRSARVRRAVLGQLRLMRHPRHAALAEQGLRDPDPSCRIEAIAAWESVEPKPASRPIEKLASDRDPRVAAAAATALAGRKDQKLTPVLLRLLGHGLAEVRVIAAAALGQLRVRTAEAPLRRLLKDPDGRVKLAAALAVESLTGKVVALDPGQPLGIPECDRILRAQRCALALTPNQTAAAVDSALGATLKGLLAVARLSGVSILVNHCRTQAAEQQKALAKQPATRGCLR